MDKLGPFPLTPRGNKFVLVVAEYFTKWTESYPIPKQEVSTAEKLVGEFICRFRVPREIASDQGTNFESKVMSEACKLLGIDLVTVFDAILTSRQTREKVKSECTEKSSKIGKSWPQLKT